MTTDAAASLREATDRLGTPNVRVTAGPGGSPTIQRSSWSCGCSLDFIESARIESAALMWQRCGLHRDEFDATA